jgi:hypothetical protein
MYILHLFIINYDLLYMNFVIYIYIYLLMLEVSQRTEILFFIYIIMEIYIAYDQRKNCYKIMKIKSLHYI